MQNRPIRIYIDHWEDYESIGDKAMLLNAMRRLEIELGPCTFVTPYTPTKPGAFLLPNMVPVTPPQAELLTTARRLRAISSKITNHLPLIPKDTTGKSRSDFELAERIIGVRMLLYSVGLKFVFRKAFRDFLELIKKCDVFFTVGDCSLNDYWLDGVEIKSWLIDTVRKFIPICAMSSQGIGPLSTPWARQRLSSALNKLDVLSFRDTHYSKDLVESEGLSGVQHRIVCDEAFTFPVSDPETAWRILENAGVPRVEPFIGVNFRNTDFTQNTAFLQEKTAKLLDDTIVATKKNIVFICMSKGCDYGCDHEAGLALRNLMDHKEQFFVLDPIGEIEDVKAIIGKAEYTMGISYHLHVFSLSQGHPTIALYTGKYYQTKLDGLLGFYGKPSITLNIAETPNSEIINNIRILESRYSEAVAHIEKVNSKILKDNDWTIKLVKQLLTEKGILTSEASGVKV